MIDPVLLRDNPELVKRSQEKRGESPETVDDAVAADKARRAAITAFDITALYWPCFGKVANASALISRCRGLKASRCALRSS